MKILILLVVLATLTFSSALRLAHEADWKLAIIDLVLSVLFTFQAWRYYQRVRAGGTQKPI
jgi:heme O synthase-like polyprenyltransferase